MKGNLAIGPGLSVVVGLILLACGAAVAAAEEAPVFWAPVDGPYQGPVKCLVADKGTVYAGTLNGVFSSADGGRHWTKIQLTGMADKIVSSLVVNPTGLIAAGAREIAYESVSKLAPGATGWADLSGNLKSKRVQASISGGVVTNGAGDLFVGTRQGVWRLAAAASNWETVGEAVVVNCMVRDGDGRLFAGTGTVGVCVSSDEGKSWNKAAVGAGANPVFALTVDDAGNVWAGTRAGLWRSVDHGKTWTATGLTKLPVSAVAAHGQQVFAGISEIQAHTVSYFGGLQRSSDGGATFKPVTAGLEGMGQVWSILVTGKSVIVGANGAYVSTDGGTTFAAANEGLGATNWIRDIAFKPDGTIFASTPSGVYRSRDGGAKWDRLINGLGNLQCFSLCVTSKDLPGGDRAGVVLVGVWSVGTNSSGNGSAKIYRSTDDGEHWKDATPGWTYSNVGTKMCALMENSRGEIFAGAQCTSGPGRLWRSTDSGKSFVPVTVSAANLGGLYVLDMNPTAPNEMYLATEMGDHFFRSSDHGTTWVHPASVNYPLADPGGFGWTLDGQTLFSGNVHGNFSSTDKGLMDTMKLPGTTLRFVTAGDGTIYAADMYRGAYRSTDNGGSWQVLNTGMGTGGGAGTDANLWSQCLKIAPDGHLWIGTQDALYRSVKSVQ